MLPRVPGEVDLALITTNYALDAKLNPTRDALAIEDKGSPYLNVVAGRGAAGLLKLAARRRPAADRRVRTAILRPMLW